MFSPLIKVTSVKPTKIEYINALSGYYRKTKGYVSGSILHKVEGEAQIIDEYEKKNPTLEKYEFIARLLLNAFAQLTCTVLYCLLVLYAMQEIFEVGLGYEFKNIALLCALFLGYNVKLRLFR